MTSKIEVGDKVHVELTVKEITDGGSNDRLLRLSRVGFGGRESAVYICTNDPAIVKHMKRPYEPEVDDIVRLKGSAADSPSLWKIIAVHGGRAWCRNVSNGIDKFYNFYFLEFVSKG